MIKTETSNVCIMGCNARSKCFGLLEIVSDSCCIETRLRLQVVKRAGDKSASAKATKKNAPQRKVGLTAHVFFVRKESPRRTMVGAKRRGRRADWRTRAGLRARRDFDYRRKGRA